MTETTTRTGALPGPLLLACAGGSLAVHVLLLLPAGLRGGGDLLAHLRLMQQMAEAPALRSVYAPAYHVVGALLEPLVGLLAVPELFAVGSAALLLAGFRAFQRAADLPDTSFALFCLWPFFFTYSFCLPKVEAAGYGLILLGFACVLRERRVALAALLVAAFGVHTASALVLGFAGGVLAIARRDWGSIGALAAGTLLAAPLPIAHVLAGCTPAQSLLFSEDDYLRSTAAWSSLAIWPRIVILASPLSVLVAGFGAAPLARHSRPVAILCALLLAIYLNELWLAPFETRLTLDLLRGLALLAIPVAAAGGLALAEHRRWLAPVLGFAALYTVAVGFVAVPRSCHVRAYTIAEVGVASVDRCVFRWSRGPAHAPRRIDAGARVP